MIIAFTGHRPAKLGGYSSEIENRLGLFAHGYLAKTKPTKIISGMALGWDQAAAKAAMLAGIPFIAAIPFKGQELKWPPRAQQVYVEILARAAEIVEVCEPGYASWKMQRRNEWMVDNADYVAALWDGSPGGTANCVAYARSKNKVIDNLYTLWKSK